MHERTSPEQLILFRKQVVWQELPREVREQTIELVTSLCLEIVMHVTPETQEDDHERSED